MSLSIQLLPSRSIITLRIYRKDPVHPLPHVILWFPCSSDMIWSVGVLVLFVWGIHNGSCSCMYRTAGLIRMLCFEHMIWSVGVLVLFVWGIHNDSCSCMYRTAGLIR